MQQVHITNTGYAAYVNSLWFLFVRRILFQDSPLGRFTSHLRQKQVTTYHRAPIDNPWYSEVQNQFVLFLPRALLQHFFIVALRPSAGHGLLILEVSRSHTTTQHSRQDSSGRVISSSQRPLPDNTRHSQQTNIHARGGIRINDLSRRATADLRLRPRGHWDRHNTFLSTVNLDINSQSLFHTRYQNQTLPKQLERPNTHTHTHTHGTVTQHTPLQCYGTHNTEQCINPLNAELNPICYLLALLGTHHFLHVSRIRVK